MDVSNTDKLNQRIRQLGIPEKPRIGDSVLYVMSRDQRVKDNHALLAAQRHALEKNIPLAVVFMLRISSGHRAREHYEWMLEGLKHVEKELAALNIPLMLFLGDPLERLRGCVRHLKPEAVYFDFSPLKGSLQLQAKFAEEAPCSVFVVDTHNIVPVWITSHQQEFSARTIRPKIHRLLAEYLVEPEEPFVHPVRWEGPVLTMSDLKGKIEALLKDISSNGQYGLQSLYPSGPSPALKRMREFIAKDLKNYHIERNDPVKSKSSGLSPYLHFGQISSLRVVLEVVSARSADLSFIDGADALVEEMVVRKELSDNFCYYNQNYLSLTGAPEWAQRTLRTHANDPREFMYSLEELKNSRTHDPAWNASQNEMRRTGKMHGYMRMYWAKKVLEWSESPRKAIDNLVYLNDFYSIDGGDPNGYVGILWSVAGLHDRPWGERAVYGTVRSMVYSGLKRKFDIQAYIDQNTNI